MEKDKAIQIVNQQLSELASFINLIPEDRSFIKWQRDTRIILENIFGKDSSQVQELKDIDFLPSVFTQDEYAQAQYDKEAWAEGHSVMNAFLQSIIDELKNFYYEEEKDTIQYNPIDSLSLLFDRFHSIARQLQSRRENRETISIEDEYDVQDLLHALLKIYFDDVRPEEWTPSYAGGSSRMDFLLKKEKLVIEVKKTRKNLTDREIGEQLIVDIKKYAEHADCSNLLCFVYDPEGRIGNPTGLEHDLSRTENGLPVLVFIRPKS
jgi:hypothetical protein